VTASSLIPPAAATTPTVCVQDELPHVNPQLSLQVFVHFDKPNSK